MTAFVFPRPGELRNASAIPVPERDLANLLITASIDRVTRPCDIPGCAECAAEKEVWGRLFDLLSSPWQGHVENWCEIYDAPVLVRLG